MQYKWAHIYKYIDHTVHNLSKNFNSIIFKKHITLEIWLLRLTKVNPTQLNLQPEVEIYNLGQVWVRPKFINCKYYVSQIWFGKILPFLLPLIYIYIYILTNPKIVKRRTNEEDLRETLVNRTYLSCMRSPQSW